MSKQIILGAVAYDAKVVTIWDGFRAYCGARGVELDYILYTSYERQVAAHLRGDVHVAWNSPLAWLQAVAAARAHGRTAHAIAMRDSDRDLTSVIVAREGGPVTTVEDLRGRKVGVGAADSPQATLIPLEKTPSAASSSSRCATTCWSASTATTSAASATPCARCSPARWMPRA